MTKILNLWLSQFKVCPSPLGALICQVVHVTCVPMVGFFMKDQPEGGEFVLFCLTYYFLPHLKMTISILIYDSVIH